MQDLHQSLKSEFIAKKNTPSANFVLAKLQWGKDNYGFSLHVESNTWISSGIQASEFLSMLGFENSQCGFMNGACWAKSVPEGFDLEKFATAFEQSYGALREAEKKLNSCGLRLSTENRSRSYSYIGGGDSYYGDGHTSGVEPKKMKESKDGNFKFVFTWQETPDSKGWTVHRHQISEKLSEDLTKAADLVGLQVFPECPQFDFDSCLWSFIQFNGDRRGDGNANIAHGYFDAHAANFSEGIVRLSAVNSIVKPFGMNI